MCKRTPGSGTDHRGVGRCDKHGGNEPDQIIEAGVTISRGLGEGYILNDSPVMGLPIDVDPTDALMWCVKVAAGEVAYFTQRVQQLNHDDVIVKHRTVGREWGEGEKGHKDIKHVETSHDRSLHILVRERQRAVDRLAKLSKMALDAGVAERTISLAEKQGELLATVIEKVVDQLGLTPKQMGILETVLPNVLLELESGAEPA